MPSELVFVVAWVMSIVFSVLVAAAIVTYVTRTWQQIRADRDGSVQRQLMDSLDQVQIQLSSVSERLQRMESRIEAPADSDLLPPTNDG